MFLLIFTFYLIQAAILTLQVFNFIIWLDKFNLGPFHTDLQ